MDGSSAEPVLVSLLPPGPNESLFDFAPCLRAGEEAAYYRDEAAITRGGILTLSEAVILQDSEAAEGGAEVVELLSSAPRVALTIPCESSLPLLAVHLKDIGRFCAIEVELRDENNDNFRIIITNRVTAVRVKDAQAVLPLVLHPGWNLVLIDLRDVLQRAFGLGYAMTTCVSVLASCRVARIYLQARPLSDQELPPFLRFSWQQRADD